MCVLMIFDLLMVTFISGSVQVSGEAQYTDDVPLPANSLHAAFVTSTKPHARLLSVDPSAALAMQGRGACSPIYASDAKRLCCF